ncbi:PQQ-binding-like beta-propeller repeat protein [Muricauda ruestringensis]|uniref:outer membrane protein assembly factor BamB family protein n=1 Tax=Flagellimonas ruestringensis TaxID=111501 RepID=UPI001CD59751|nr:PQQ-binding-like beta-propeller repeat protein [Allomuricauda ruestringensis]MCA0959962.1 PQQ-binding-like beta-propeller repeat protein [Allomuricauda ruestringensis]
MLRNNYLMLVLALCITTTYAQDKLWEVNLNEKLYKVSWIEQTNDGLILAAGDKGLMALDNNTGAEVWFNETLKSADRNSFLSIPGLPMFYAEYVPIIGKTRGVLINSSNGDILFDTKENGYKVKGFTVYPEQAMILFELVQDKMRYLMRFSLRTWTEEWMAPVGKNKENLLQKAFGGVSFVDHEPQFDQNGNMIIGIDDEMYVINPENGSELWHYEANKKIKALVYSPISNSIYVGIKKSNKLTILDPKTGEDITPGKLKLRGYMIDLVEDDDTDNLILVETEGFNILDPETNNLLWKKSYKMDPLTEVIPNGSDFIAIGKGEKVGQMARVDANGKKVWDTKISGYAYFNSLTKKGVMYISTARSNIIDYDTGKDVWKRDVKFRSIPAVAYDEKEDKVVIFENGNAYKFDLETGDIDLFAENVELEKVSRKTPLQAEYVMNKGYFLFTDQHVSMLSNQGELVYTDYYQPASSSNALIALGDFAGSAVLGVDLDIAGSIENINMLTDLSNGVYRSNLDQNGANQETSLVAGLYVDNGYAMQPVLEVTKTRYFNSQQTLDHHFLVTKVKSDTAPTKHSIYMVNKATGKIEKEIDLLDKTPNYLVDIVDNRVFVNQNNELLTSYQF